MYTVKCLYKLAKRYDVTGRSKLRKKEDLQKAIQALKDPIIKEKIEKKTKKI